MAKQEKGISGPNDVGTSPSSQREEMILGVAQDAGGILNLESLSGANKQDLTVKLRNKYWYNQNDLSPNERGFLAENLDSLKIETSDREMFMRLKSEYDLAPKKISYEKKSINFKDEILHSKINSLFEKAEQTLQRFLRLAASGYVMPEAGYKPEKTGGFAKISIDGMFKEARQIGGGEILERADEAYGTNSIKYSRAATEKLLQMALSGEEYSEKAIIRIAGGITFTREEEGRKIGFAYSGGTPKQDQAIVIIAAHDAETMSEKEFKEKQRTLDNPYLTQEFLTALESS